MSHQDPQARARTLPKSGDTRSDELPLSPGQLVGNFRIVRLVGRGGMGAVFEALHERIERRAAIKVLYAEFAQHPQLVVRFIDEARAVNLARHPGLVEIFDIGQLEGGAPYLLMEYLEGEVLIERMLRLRGPLPEALSLARQIAFALSAAHDKGIVHRDLKPDNVIILHNPDPPHLERIKVLDFGVAKLASQPLVGRGTLTGVVLGTPQYMAPEQCLGLVNVDGRADVYSLGVMLYEMLSGQLPFVAEEPFDYMALHVRQEPPPLLERSPYVAAPVADLVHRMLAKKPAQRPSMNRVALELLRLEDLSGAPLGPESGAMVAAPSSEDALRVLIVDDDPDFNAMLGLLLEKQGYVCQRMDHGAAVLETVRAFRPHIVLLDVELPDKSGYMLCWSIKSSPETKDTLVVLMSGKSKEADRKLGISMQADAYVTKPFEMADMLAVMQLLLDRPGRLTTEPG